MAFRRKVLCVLLLQIKCLDPLLAFPKNSGNALIDLPMGMLEIFFLPINFSPLGGLSLGRVGYNVWNFGVADKRSVFLVNFTLTVVPLTALLIRGLIEKVSFVSRD